MELGETMTDDELKLMISEANGSDKAYTVTEEQFAQVLTRATNLWYLIPVYVLYFCYFCLFVLHLNMYVVVFELMKNS